MAIYNYENTTKILESGFGDGFGQRNNNISNIKNDISVIKSMFGSKEKSEATDKLDGFKQAAEKNKAENSNYALKNKMSAMAAARRFGATSSLSKSATPWKNNSATPWK